MFVVSEFLGVSLPYIKVSTRTKFSKKKEKRLADLSALKMELK